MEAATTPMTSPSPRDGFVPAAPPAPTGVPSTAGEPIDGVARCSCCKRFPLIGEQVVRHVGPDDSGWVCEGCEAAGRGDRIGPPDERARIRSCGGAMNVRRAA
jgi:hypothetical protein